MRKKQLKKIVDLSYSNELLNTDVVGKIANLLKRKDLKQYIKALKMKEKENNVIVDTPLSLSLEEKGFLEKLFLGKRIEYRNLPELILGIRITESDNIYDFSLSNKLGSIVSYLS